MCGIVGAVAERNITAILLEGLKRLEYRGYDSAGVAVLDENGTLERLRRNGKVAELEQAQQHTQLAGRLGIAHTRWDTHGAPCERNAHPHFSGDDLAVVHNGIIENHEALRARLKEMGYVFVSDTDTEVIVHLLHHKLDSLGDLTAALKAAVKELHGAYGLAVISAKQPDRLLAARSGSPLVIGLGLGENFLASDQLALRQVTDRFMYLEEGDIAEIRRDAVQIWDVDGQPVQREAVQYHEGAEAADKGEYRHFMLKEIFEQPQAISDTLAGTLGDDHVLTAILGPEAETRLADIANIHIVACGTSYHAGLVARYWIEEQAGIPCQVEVASEYRYRSVVVPANTLLITISQSGETADTLAALRYAKDQGYLATLAICNVAGSSLVREADWRLLTHAGPEIGVASTKAFTTQLVGLLMLTLILGRYHGLSSAAENAINNSLRALPESLDAVMKLEDQIIEMAEDFDQKEHALFLGRGIHYPVAMEGALKLKEISYIHAEAYPAGELKHGPLALVDSEMPVVAVAPNDDLLEKLGRQTIEVERVIAEAFPARAQEILRSFEAMRLTETTANRLIEIRDLPSGGALQLCQDCSPVLGDRIVGLQKKGQPITVHCIDCNRLGDEDAEYARWFDLSWSGQPDGGIMAMGRIKVTAINRPGVMAQLCSAIAESGGNILSVQSGERSIDFTDLMFDIEVADLKHLTLILATLRALSAVDRVERIRG